MRKPFSHAIRSCVENTARIVLLKIQYFLGAAGSRPQEKEVGEMEKEEYVQEKFAFEAWMDAAEPQTKRASRIGGGQTVSRQI